MAARAGRAWSPARRYRRRADDPRPIAIGGAARLGYSTHYGFPDGALDAYSDYYIALDTRTAAILGQPVGTLFADGVTFDYAQTMRTEIWQDFYRPAGLGQAIGLRLSALADGIGVLSFHRARDAAPPGSGEFALMRIAAGHVDRSLRLQRHLAVSEDAGLALRQGLDRFLVAVLLLTASLVVVALNRAAEALLDRPEQPLRCRDQRLTGRDGAACTALLRLVESAAASVRTGTPPPVLRLQAGTPAGTVALLAVPVRRHPSADRADRPLVLLFVSEPDRPIAPDRAAMAAEFGLTAAEAEVAALLLDGVRVAGIAQARGVSPETVRAQLKSILHKTGTTSQGQLISRLSRGLATALGRG